MCGIIGYIGKREASSILLQGLKRMEYRGYDSAGVSIITGDNKLFTHKRSGNITKLRSSLKLPPDTKGAGIGHTRWATHGVPSAKNAHPIVDGTGRFAVVHNGIIENYQTLKKNLIQKGYKFSTDTDTEVIVQLISDHYRGDLNEAVRKTLKDLWGAYGIVVVSSLHPDMIIAARKGSPMVIGFGEGENFVASDVTAFLKYTRNILNLEDDELAVIRADNVETKTLENSLVTRERETVLFDLKNIEKGGYPHYMLKEIHEQPETVRDSFRGRIILDEGKVKLGGLDQVEKQIRKAGRIILTGCGTSWHAALVGEYLIEELARLPVEVEYASEFRYRNPVLSEKDVVIALSQSGETADTLAAVREAKKAGALVLGLCNVVGSAVARETDGGIYIHAGPEIGVASTKAFTSQVIVLILLSVFLGREKYLDERSAKKILKEVKELPQKIEAILKNAAQIEEIAGLYNMSRNFLYLGRGYNFPVALEGALKLKEISYIHAEGYPAAEMKHGPIALIDESMPVVFIARNEDPTYPKIISNIQAVRARKGKVIAIATEGDEEIRENADKVIYIPGTLRYLSPILTVIPLQLLAYYIAVQRGCDVDHPRNLAKSVTVE
ncbi:glutamine--fructose-6-phosphate transaminase (isomerizing) [candidate division KSB1 bacterium]